MSNHSSEYDGEMMAHFEDLFKAEQPQETVEQLRKQLESSQENFGPTGNFPEGKLTSNDEGEIKFAVAAVKGKVVIDFQHPVNWIGMKPKQAHDLAQTLIKHARKAKEQLGF